MEPNTILALVSALGGAVVGAIAATFGNLIIERRREKSERKALAAAIRAEILAIKSVEEKHNYRAIYQKTLDRIEAWHSDPMPNISFEQDTSRSVYYMNLSRIGILPPDVAEVLVRLAYQIEVINTDKQPKDQRVAFLEHHLNTYDGVWQEAEELAERLASVAR